MFYSLDIESTEEAQLWVVRASIRKTMHGENAAWSDRLLSIHRHCRFPRQARTLQETCGLLDLGFGDTFLSRNGLALESGCSGLHIPIGRRILGRVSLWQCVFSFLLALREWCSARNIWLRKASDYGCSSRISCTVAGPLARVIIVPLSISRATLTYTLLFCVNLSFVLHAWTSFCERISENCHQRVFFLQSKYPFSCTLLKAYRAQNLFII